MALTIRRRPVFYTVSREVPVDEIDALYAAGEVRLVAIRARRDPFGIPRLGVCRRPGLSNELTPGQVARVERAWNRAEDFEVGPTEFGELLDGLQLRVVIDTHGFYHLTRSANRALWEGRVGRPAGYRPRRRRRSRSFG